LKRSKNHFDRKMDKVLPLELLYEVAKHLHARDYLHFRVCSSATLGLRKIIEVGFQEYKALRSTWKAAFRDRHVVSLKAGHIHTRSIRFLASWGDDFELIRILRSHYMKSLCRKDMEDAFDAAKWNSCAVSPDIFVALLREGNLNPNYTFAGINNGDWSIIHWACYFGITEVVKELLSMEDADVTSPCTAMFPQHYAAFDGHIDVIHLLFNDKRFNVRERDGWGRTCLGLATENNPRNFEFIEVVTNYEQNAL
jgi:Ankyrin repeats (3 copies)